MVRCLFFCLLMLNYLVSNSQLIPQTIGAPNTAVKARGNFGADSTLSMPKRLISPTRDRDTGSIYYRISDSTILKWTGNAWRDILGARQLNDSMFIVGSDTITIRGTGGGTNVRNSSGTADGDYTQNWNHHRFYMDSVPKLRFSSTGYDADFINNRAKFLFEHYNGSTAARLKLLWSLRNVTNSSDSLGSGLNSDATETTLDHYGNAGNQIARLTLAGNTPFPAGQILAYDGSKTSTLTVGNTTRIDPADSLKMRITPAATADSILGIRALEFGLNTIVKIPASAIVATPGGSNSQIQYNNSGAFGAEAAFNYNATTNKLSADSIESKKINTDSLRIVKSPILADDTLLTRKANGNVGKVWNIGVNHLDNGTSATKNTAWYGNGKWEANGVHTFFKVDEGSFPAAGDSIYSNASLASYQRYYIYREGPLQYMDTIDGVEIDTATGTIIFHPPLVANERIQITADKLSPLRGQPFVQFDINTIPNVRAWFDATDAPTVTIATGVSQWDDKTPNNNDLIQASGANQPLYFSTGGSGNQAFVRFTTTDALNRTFPVADSAAITMYMVVKQATYTNTYVQYSWGNTGGPDGLIPSVNSDPAGVYWGYGNYDGSGQNSANLNTGWGDWQLVKSVYRGGNNNYVTKNKEGAMKYIESPEGIGAGSPGTLKNEHILFQYAYDNWEMSEAVLITGEPSPTNDNNIKAYLMSKYQIPAKKSLLMFGDSHTQGIESGTTTGRAYYLTTAKDQGYDVMNMGISGTVAYPIGSFGGMTGKNLSDLYTQFDQYIVPNDPYVIFQYGTNDGTSPVNAAWVTSYKASIQHFLDLGVPASKIIICTPPYNTNATYATNLANAVPVIAGIATDLGIQYCDFYTYLQGLSLDINAVPGGDGIHGNLAIHNAMSDLLKTFLP